MIDLPYTHSCFVCGDSNRSGLRLKFQADGNVVRATFTPGPEHIGFRQTIHGGIISSLLDEIMVWACAVQTRRFAFCAELTVRFLKPLQPGQLVEASAELVQNRRDRIYLAKGELQFPGGEAVATAEGKYMPVPAEQMRGMAADLIGPLGFELL
ncbi:MAG TPA: PaaI family thioesterase [Verrucomicrobiae bacterium]|nr:PaaI family thioesterase [Verrucomicrobiae bacterium]